MNKKYSLVLFDMDGTLVDTDEMIRQSMYILYDKYRDGKRSPDEEIWYFSGPPIRETLAKEFPHMDLDFMYEEFHKVSWELYKPYAKAYPNAYEVIHKLKKAGYKLGVVTNKIHDTTMYCLDLINMRDIFDVVIGYNDVSVGKPSPEGILKAMELTNIKNKHEVLYIGDNKVDLDTANNAGVNSALVYWGPRVLSKELKPTLKISSYKDLWRKLGDE